MMTSENWQFYFHLVNNLIYFHFNNGGAPVALILTLGGYLIMFWHIQLQNMHIVFIVLNRIVFFILLWNKITISSSNSKWASH